MNKTLIKIAEQYEKTAKELLRKAEQLRNGINPNKCKYGTYTNELFNTHGCKTCGSPKLVLCSNEKKNKIANRFSSKYCNPANCKYFES